MGTFISIFFFSVHWLPPECYANPDAAKRSTQADVWAVATTLWEIFSLGATIPASVDIETIKRVLLCSIYLASV